MFRIVSTWQIAKGTFNLTFWQCTPWIGNTGSRIFFPPKRNVSEQEWKASVKKKWIPVTMNNSFKTSTYISGSFAWNVKWYTEAMTLLQVQRCLQHFVCHWDGHCIPNCPRQTSARLGKRDQVRESVSDPSPSEDPEMQQGCVQLRAAESIQQSNAKKWDNIFKVIQVASGERSKVVLQCYILLNKPLQASLFFSVFRSCYC